MRVRFIVLGVLLLLGSMQAAIGAESVDIRFVRAFHGNSVSPALRDVESLLRSNLPYRGFELLSRTSMSLPNRGQSARMARGFRVRCSGDARRFSVRVNRGDDTALNVAVALREGKPVILGGFPDGEDRLLLVLVAR